VGAPLFNKVVWQSADGRGYYNAEINVQGKIVYGYNWSVRSPNQGAGYYRITFSLDGVNCSANLNTFLDTTKVVEPTEEEMLSVTAEPGGGGIATMDYANELGYIDVQITSQCKGGDRAARRVDRSHSRSFATGAST
jgi:hypothetical protein